MHAQYIVDVGLTQARHHSDALQAWRLLGSRRGRSRGRAAEKRDKLAPLHGHPQIKRPNPTTSAGRIRHRPINFVVMHLAKVTLIAGDVLRPLSIVDALRTHGVTKIAHTAANPLLTLGAQKEPYLAINLNIMGTVNVLEAARVTGLKRVVVSSSSVLNHYLEGGEDDGNFGKEEAFPRPTTFYSATKQAVESLGLNYAKWCGIEFAGLRYGAVFGPWNGAGGGGPSNIVREAMRNALAGKRRPSHQAQSSGLFQGCGAGNGHGARRQRSRQPGV